MKATEASLLSFLKKSPQFVIPIYQRTYSWTESECRQLLDDILRAGADQRVAGHFMGAVVYIEQGLFQVMHQSPLLVIDGQQRLTTVMLILEAVARRLDVVGEVDVEDFTPQKVRGYYLQNPLESGDRRHKLVLTQTDKSTLKALIGQQNLPDEPSVRISENFEFFVKEIEELGPRLSTLCRGLTKLMIVDISLSREHDNPQLIFESMNSTGRELTQADLVRNFVLMGLEPEHQTKLYEGHWRPMELRFGQAGYGEHFDKFMRHYLTVKTGDIPKINEVYDAFKSHARVEATEERSTDDLVREVETFATHYCAMALGKESEPALAAVFADLRELRVDVAYPMLLEVYNDYANGLLTLEEFLEIARTVEAYVFRRAISSIPTNSLNKTFARFMRTVDKTRYLQSVKANFLLMRSYRRFPTDDEFHRELQTRDLYNFPRRSYWLRRMENHDRKEHVPVQEYTIEHIMPQNSNLSPQWQEELGPDWQAIHEARLHTLGNLTLTGYNSMYSDRPFAQKRDIENGFADSPLRLNKGMGSVERWSVEAMDSRANRLAELAQQVWSIPEMPPATLDSFRPTTGKSAAYTIADHPNLAPTAQMRKVFDAFQEAVLALDPCVNEEFLKLYVAYKAETNFADVIPQVKSLVISLNLDIADLADPHGIAEDVSDRGRWGNGNIEVRLTNVDQIPYVVGLVRQALERQMSDEY